MSVNAILLAILHLLLIFKSSQTYSESTRNREQTENEVVDKISKTILDHSLKLALLKMKEDLDSDSLAKLLKKTTQETHSKLKPLIDTLRSVSSNPDSTIKNIMDSVKKIAEEGVASSEDIHARSGPARGMVAQFADLIAESIVKDLVAVNPL